jgi:hypothetical protein
MAETLALWFQRTSLINSSNFYCWQLGNPETHIMFIKSISEIILPSYEKKNQQFISMRTFRNLDCRDY